MAYLPLSTANLPDPVIDPAAGSSPEDYFNTVLYTGNNTNGHAITGVGFQPDFTWVKRRSATGDHILSDAVRTAGKYLSSNLTAAEITSTDFDSFDSDGFTVNDVDATGGLNASGSTYVAWNWKANGSGVSNTDGSITSTVSANTESGFSIVTYTGTGSATTVGHGLDSALDMLMVKRRDSSGEWLVWHPALDANNQAKISLNTTDAAYDPNTGLYWNSTAPTSSVIHIGTSGNVNGSSATYVAYCFHSVEGFSKFGSYTGNGSTDGPFVYTGFKVGWLMIKRTDSTHNWYIFDSTRTTTNPQGYNLMANSYAAEDGPNNIPLDFLSNGFKPRGTGASQNASGGTYIYMAFAENPFKYSNAR